MNTKNNIKELKNLENIFDFSNLDENHELFSKNTKQFINFFQKEIFKKIWID